jgi:heat shock protein HtpX
MNKASEVLVSLGGIEVSKSRAPFLMKRIERLAARAKLPTPRLYIIPNTVPNACAVGLSIDDSAVGVTTGLLCNLDENEIEAVLAHEIGHIQKGHSIEKTKVAMKALLFTSAARAGGRMIATSDLDLTPDDDDSDDLASMLIKVGIGVAISAAGDAVASSMLSSSSFQSEFEADEVGGRLAGKPWALVSALRKLQELSSGDVKNYAPEVSQLFIISPSYLEHKTHPSTMERISFLSNLKIGKPELPQLPTIFCDSCGEKTDEDGNYCYWCGCSLVN